MWGLLLLLPLLPTSCVAWAQTAPMAVQGHLLASKAYAEAGDAAHAVAEAEAALAIDPRSEAAHLQLGQIFLSNHTPAAARDIFAEALVLFPESFLLRLGEGLALSELQRYDEAARALRRCLAMQPSSGIAFDALGTVLLHSSDFEGLLREAEEYRRRNPADYRGAYYAAAARDGLRLPDGPTLALLEQSIEISPGFAAAYGLKGKVLLRQGSLPEAVTALERAVALRRDHVPSHMALANAYRKSGRDAEAAREFQTVRELNEAQRIPPPSLVYHRGNGPARP